MFATRAACSPMSLFSTGRRCASALQPVMHRASRPHLCFPQARLPALQIKATRPSQLACLQRTWLHTSRILPAVQEEKKGEEQIDDGLPGASLPEPIPLPPFALEILRGMGQVIFCNSTFTGSAIIAGMLLADPQLAGLAVLGCATSTATSRLIGANAEAISAGLTGYNGALVGCGFSVFLGYSLPIVAAWTIAGSACSALIAWGLGRVLPLPQWTWAFNIVILSTLACMKGPEYQSNSPPLRFGELDPLAWLGAILAGLSQIFLVCNGYSGALILAGVAAYSPMAAGAALLGSTLGALTGIFFAKDAAEVEDGLWGFNPALTALAVSVFFVPLGLSYGALLCGGAVATAIAAISMRASMDSALGTPAFTTPFCLIASICFLLGGRVPGLVRAPSPHSPERNLRAFRARPKQL